MDLGAGELLERIALGEGKDLEFKRGLPREPKVARTLCAFANTRGGLLLVGVGDRGELFGAPRPRESVSRLRDVAAGWLEPPVAVEVGHVRAAGRVIVWCSVPISPRRPHAALDEEGERTILVRVGASNRAATGPTLRAIRAQRAGGERLDALQRRVLAWVAERTTDAPGSAATVARFARAHNIGLQRARRAFTELELGGRLVGHGSGARRTYGLP